MPGSALWTGQAGPQGHPYTRLLLPAAGREQDDVRRDPYTVSFTDRSDAPIYAELVAELGDAPAEARRTAEQTQRELERTMNFNGMPSYEFS